MGFLGLIFPVLLVLMFIIALMWLFNNKRLGLALLVLICAGYKNISVIFSWKSSPAFSDKKPQNCIRILGWNINDFHLPDYDDLFFNSSHQHPAFSYIQKLDADIICLQDFLEYSINKGKISTVDFLKDSLHYSYYYFASNYKPPFTPKQHAGIAIFSKIPLTNTQRILYPEKLAPESIITADININNITRRIIITHLQSMYLTGSRPAIDDPRNNNQAEDTAVRYSGSIFKKLKYYLPYHAKQAELVKKQIDESPYPVIFSADMNEVPTSYVYHRIKGDMIDVFLKKGFGLGRTYYKISPTLRIDYLMVSPNIDIVQYKKDNNLFLSDHYPQVMDVKW